ncbi:MAG: amidase [Actinomycetota bacterium]
MVEAGSLRENIPGTSLDATAVTVGELGQALAAGQLTSAALTDFYLRRIERLNPGLRAVIEVSPSAAADSAASDSERARANGAPARPLAGIPVIIKDNIAVDGQPATAGSPALSHSGTGDACLVSRLREAGAIVLGKANLSEWANFRSNRSSSGWSTLGGQAVNPYGNGRNPSGSSSGSAVAVAAGLAPIAVGTETDGSILSPASACGLVGIKPTLGLVSRAGIVPISPEQDTAGPMARSVADAVALLDVLAAPDSADEATTRAPAPPDSLGALLAAGALDGCRIGIWRDGASAANPATLAVLDAAVARLRASGTQLTDPVELPGLEGLAGPEFGALLHEFKHYLNAYLAATPGDHPATLADLIAYNSRNAATVLPHFGQELFEAAEATSGDLADADYLAARSGARTLATTALDTALQGSQLDAVVTLSGSPAWLIDHVLGDHHIFGTSSPAAVAGYPSITVPAGAVAGLPVGLTFIGPAWSEPRLFALAYAFEQSA